jgi:hypothetical protein
LLASLDGKQRVFPDLVLHVARGVGVATVDECLGGCEGVLAGHLCGALGEYAGFRSCVFFCKKIRGGNARERNGQKRADEKGKGWSRTENRKQNKQ